MQGRQALTSANKEQLGGTRAPWPQGSIRKGCPRGSPSFEDPDPPALQEEMLSWLQGVSTAINESQSIRVKAQSLPLPPITGPDASLGKKDKEKRFSFFPKKK